MTFNQSLVRLRALPALLAGFVVLSTAALSQSQFWGPANGPFGAITKTIVADGQGNIYAGTSGAGVFRSTDNGDTWTAVNNGLDNHHISTDHLIWALAASPGGELVAASFGTLYHSSDRGSSWNEAEAAPWITLFSAVVSARDGSFIGAATAGGGEGIYRSTDGGATWTQTGLEENGIRSLIVTGTGSILAGCNESEGIYRSTDNGATWHATSLTDMKVHEMVADSSGLITTGLVDGEYAQSNDDGITWEKIQYEPDVAGFGTIAVSPEGDIYNSSANGLFTTGGWGAEWTRISSEPFARNAGCLTFAPNGDLFVGTYREGIYRYRPSSGEWKEINNGLTNRGASLISHPDGITYAAGYQGILYSSDDKGKTWSLSATITSVPLVIYPTGEMVTDDGTTKDGGITWTPLTFPDNMYPSHMTIGPAGKLYAIFSHSVQVSSDTGTSWTPIFETTQYVDALTVDREGTIVVATDSMELLRVYRSTDGGAAWSFVDIDEMVFKFAVDSTGALLAATDQGIYRSTDAGASWRIADAPFIEFTSLVVSRRGHIYAGSADDGVYRSTDNGATWTQMNGGLENLMIVSLAVDYDDYIYAGTEGSGVFVHNSVSSGVEWEAAASRGLALRSHPNPFAEETTIRFSLPRTTHVSLMITNTLGQPVAVLAEEEMEQGDHKISWNPTDLPHGLYFCTLKTGDRTETMRVIHQ